MKKKRAPRNTVGKTIRSLRFERGLSQPDLAAICQRMGWDVSRDIIARIEDQRRWVADFELSLLGKALGINPSNLLPDIKTSLDVVRFLQKK